jgi:hypothetical protein
VGLHLQYIVVVVVVVAAAAAAAAAAGDFPEIMFTLQWNIACYAYLCSIYRKSPRKLYTWTCCDMAVFAAFSRLLHRHQTSLYKDLHGGILKEIEVY